MSFLLTDIETGTGEKSFAQGLTGSKRQGSSHRSLDSVDPKPILFTSIQVLLSRSWEKITGLSGKERTLANPLLKGQVPSGTYQKEPCKLPRERNNRQFVIPRYDTYEVK